MNHYCRTIAASVHHQYNCRSATQRSIANKAKNTNTRCCAKSASKRQTQFSMLWTWPLQTTRQNNLPSCRPGQQKVTKLKRCFLTPPCSLGCLFHNNSLQVCLDMQRKVKRNRRNSPWVITYSHNSLDMEKSGTKPKSFLNTKAIITYTISRMGQCKKMWRKGN